MFRFRNTCIFHNLGNSHVIVTCFDRPCTLSSKILILDDELGVSLRKQIVQAEKNLENIRYKGDIEKMLKIFNTNHKFLKKNLSQQSDKEFMQYELEKWSRPLNNVVTLTVPERKIWSENES